MRQGQQRAGRPGTAAPGRGSGGSGASGGSGLSGPAAPGGRPAAPGTPSGWASWCATVAGLAVPGYLAVLTAAQWLASRLLALASGLPSASLAHPVGVDETAVILLEAACNLLALAAAALWAARQAKLRPAALRLRAPRRRRAKGVAGGRKRPESRAASDAKAPARAKTSSPAEVAFAPAFLAGSLLLSAAGAALGRWLGLPARAVQLPAGGRALAASYLALCLVPAAGEELLFRGVLPAVLRPLGPRAAVWGAALLFALAHGSLPQCLAALWAGLALGWYAHRRGSIWPGAALHLCHNTVNFCGSLLQTRASPEAAAVLTAAYLAALTLWLAAALLRARRPRGPRGTASPAGPGAAHPAAQTAADPAAQMAARGAEPHPTAQTAARTPARTNRQPPPPRAAAQPARRLRAGPLRALQTLFACPGYRLSVLGLALLMLWRWLR